MSLIFLRRRAGVLAIQRHRRAGDNPKKASLVDATMQIDGWVAIEHVVLVVGDLRCPLMLEALWEFRPCLIKIVFLRCV